MAGDDMGAAVLYEMSHRLKRAGQGDLRKRFHKDMRELAKPLLPKVRGVALARFPHRGGLDRHMSKGSRYRTVVRTGVDTAGVSIRANRTDPRVDSEGRIVHPVPKVGGTRVEAHTAQTTSVKTRKTRTRKVAASEVGGEFVTNAEGRRVVVVQRVPAAVGFFSSTIAGAAPQIRQDLIAGLERWATETLRG